MVLGHGDDAALDAVDQGDRFPPIPLPGKHPVPEAIVDRLLSLSLLFQIRGDLLFELRRRETVVGTAVDGDPFILENSGRIGDGVPGSDDLFNGNAELLGEIPIPAVVSGHGHDGAGAVGG